MAEANQLSPTETPETPEGNIVTPDEFWRQDNAPTGYALTRLDKDPEEAGQATKLAQATGIPPSVISSDLERYNEMHRRSLTWELLNNNRHLRDYIRWNPHGADVSNDDWGQLDKISQVMDRVLGKFGIPGPSMLQAAARGFAEGHQPGIGVTQEEWQTLDRFSTNNPLMGAFLQVAMKIPQVAGPTQLAHELPRLFQGGLTAGMAAAEQWYINQGGDPRDAAKFARDFGVGVQVALPEVAEGIGGPRAAMKEGLRPAEVPPELSSTIKKAGEAAQVAHPWLKAGEAPPPLLHPYVLQVAKTDARASAKVGDELFKESQKSSTLGRDPESFRAFVEAKLGDRAIGISAEKAQELYGDGLPEPGDNKLGFIPDIKVLYQRALDTGADIKVPWKDYLARVSPEVHDVLHDGLRYNEDELTLDESKEAEPAKLEPYEEEYGKPYERPTQAPAEKPVTKFEPHETLSAMAGHGWEAAETQAGEPKFLELPETGEPGKPFTGALGITGKSLSTFPLRDVIDQMQEHFKELPEDAQLLSKFWGNRLAELGGDTPIHVVDRADFKKVYPQFPNAGGVHFRGEIAIPHDILTQYPGWYASQILLHEGAHAISVDALYNYPKLKDAATELMAEVKNFHGAIPSEFKYAFTDAKEFIAEGVANPGFRRILMDTPLSKEMTKTLDLGLKTGSIWDAVRQIFKDLWHELTGKVPENSVMDAFFRLHEAIEEANKILEGVSEESFADKPDLQRVFKNGRALGMNNETLKKYMNLGLEQLDRDAKLKRDAAEVEAGARATKEWANNYDRVRAEVKEEIYSRSDIGVDRLLRTGFLPNGEKMGKVKLDPKAVDPALRDRIPKEFLAPGGLSPDTLAPVFKYDSGNQLVRSIARLADEREVEGLTPAGHVEGLVRRETEARMQREYGRSAQDILDDAQAHLTVPTRFDLMHMELNAVAEKAGRGPITADMIKRSATETFNGVANRNHSVKEYINQIAKNGQAFEKAVLDQDWVEAFKTKQRQVLLTHQLKLATKLEKLIKSFESHADRWSERDPGTPPESAVWMHDILRRIGYDKEIGLQDLERRKALYTNYKRLRDFVEAKNNSPRGAFSTDPDVPQFGRQMPVADILLSENYTSRVPDMYPPEFKEVYDSLKTIYKNGRDELVSEVRGKKEETKKVVGGLVERIKAREGGEPITKGEQRASIGRTLGSFLLTPETWFNRLDMNNRFGPFNQLIVRPLMEAQYDLRKYEKEFAAKWKALGKFPDYYDKIENPGLWLDPKDGFAIDMHKGMAYAALQNMGNALQRKKLLMGWGIAKTEEELPAAEAKVWSWLQSVGIEEKHLDRAQAMGNVFSDAFSLVERASQHLSGVAPARIDLYDMDTPWGKKKEWYHPLTADPIRRRQTDAPEVGDNGFHRPAPAAGHTKERTGAIYPLDLSINSASYALKEMLNLAAMKVAIHDVGKLLYHPDFQEAFRKYIGKEYSSALDAWIKDLAGNRQWVPSNVKGIENVIVQLANNLSTLQIGLNLGTVLKHGPTAGIFSASEVGTARFLKHLSIMVGQGFKAGELWKFVMENSEEVQNRWHSMNESLSAADKDLIPTVKGKWATAREVMQRIGFAPVAASDLISAVAMWSAEYERLLEKNPDMTHGDAVYGANTAVRRTHGSSLLASRAQILRQGPLWRAISPYYNFFSNALQRTYEGSAQSKALLRGVDLPEMPGFDREVFAKNRANAAKVLMGTLFVFGVLPSLTESLAELSTGEVKENEGWPMFIFRSLTQALPAQVPIGREIVNYLQKGYDPKLGMFGTFERDVKDAIPSKAWIKDPGTFLRRANMVSGLLTGIGYDPVGRVGQFWLNVQDGKEHPRNPWDYWKGTMRGTLREHRR